MNINPEDLKPNSHKYREEQKTTAIEKKKIEKVVTGKTQVRKKNEIRKLADVFISEDIRNVKSYVIMDVLIPTIKKAVSDIVTNGIDMILFGESGRKQKSSNASRISYASYYDRNRDDRHSASSQASTRYNYDDVIIETRGEAEEVLTRMEELIDVYGMVSVADFYELVDVTGNYTDNKYGWTNLHSATIVRARGGSGYMIKLPRAIPLN